MPLAGAISIGDLIRVLGTLRVEDDVPTSKAIEHLGYRRIAPLVTEGVTPKSPEDATIVTSGPDKPPPVPPRKPPPVPLGGGVPMPFEVIPLETSSMTEVVPVQAVPLPPADPGEAWWRPEYQSLFVETWVRGIVTLALSTVSVGGVIDIDRLTSQLAAGKAVTHLPHRAAPTLRQGVLTLVDRSAGMEPFMRDQDVLTAGITQVVGSHLTKSHYFQRLPIVGPDSDIWDDVPKFQWPAPGVVILLLSDLGRIPAGSSMERASLQEWGIFADRAVSSGNPIVVFTPLAPSRYPIWLRKKLVLIHWDRKTTAGMIRREVGIGHRTEKRYVY